MLAIPATQVEIERALAESLARPGLMPRIATAPMRDPVIVQRLTALIGDPLAHAARPATEMPAELLAAWTEGLVYLVDARSSLTDQLVVHAKRVVIRHAAIGAFTSIYGNGIVIESSLIKGHTTLNGPVLLAGGHLSWHVLIGPFAIIRESTLGAFCKAQRYVQIDRSRIGSGTLMEGGTHPEMLPLGPTRREIGVHVGPDAWIGQQASLTAGAVIGPGTVVASQTSITRAFPPHVFVSGSPARTAPIDLAIRGLSPEAAEAEGERQDHPAAVFPIYGGARSELASPRELRLVYRDHGHLRGLASEQLVHFQRGALRAAFALLFPGNAVTLEHRIDDVVYFVATFAAPLPDPIAFSDPEQSALWRAITTAPSTPPAASTDPAPRPVPRSGDALATIAEILERLVPMGRTVDLDQTFDALGIDSLGKVELTVTLEERLGIPTPDVFAHNTMRKLAAEIARERALIR